MNELDQTILIAAAPDAVWAYVSDLNQNPAWQSDCQSVVFLSKQRSGKGTRWRYRNLSDKEYELEITAWYDGLGYEYRYLDGRARGRIRLHEIAEGTTIQWTLSYETQGRLGGMRNALGLKRNYRKFMDDSLLALQVTVRRSIGNDNSFEARSLMRDSLAYEARVNYRPRHPSSLRDGAGAPSLPPIEEPPVLEEDTRPHPALADASEDSPLTRQPVESEPTPEVRIPDVPPLPAARLDSSDLSIWDIFGVQRPDEPAEPLPQPATVAESTVAEPAYNTPASVPLPLPVVISSAPEDMHFGHPGLRKLQRNRRALRRTMPN